MSKRLTIKGRKSEAQHKPMEEKNPDIAMSRRAFLIGGGAAAALVGLEAVSSKQEVVVTDKKQKPATAKPIESTTTTTESTTTTTEKLRTTPEFPKLAELPNGAFVGAVQILYKDNPDRPWDEINSYYQRKGQQRPPMNNPFAHQTVVGTNGESGVHVTEENLAHGFVLDKTSVGNNIVGAMHNISSVNAPVVIDGQEFSQSQMGINAVVMPGDRMVLSFQNEESRMVDVFEFEAKSSWIFDVGADRSVAEDSINRLFYPETDSEGVMLQTYKCWPPGSDRQRIVDVWQQVSAETTLGSVAQGNNGIVGPPQPDL